MKTTTTLLLFLGAIIFFGFVPVQKKNNDLPISISYNSSLHLVSEQHLEKYDYTEYSSGEDILQLKYYHNVTKEKAQKIISDRKFYISSMFKDQPSPYPGVLTTTVGCPEELVPKPNEDTASVRLDFKLYATRNLVYGNCNITDNYFYCLYFLFFCDGKKEFFELKIFTPIKKPSFNCDTLIASVKCKD